MKSVDAQFDEVLAAAMGKSPAENGPERRAVVGAVLEVAHIEVGIDVDDTDVLPGLAAQNPRTAGAVTE